MEPENLSLDQYVIQQAQRERPKVCFIPTARGDADDYVLQFYEAFTRLNCQPSYLSLFQLPTADLEAYILEKHIVYVGGGNTQSLLALWRAWGLDLILRKAYEKGIVLAGISAGANCWFQQCTTDSVPGELRVLGCLGLLPGSFTPHYDGEHARRPTLHRMLKEGLIAPGFAADDGAAIHFVNGEPLYAVRSRPTAEVYRVTAEEGHVVEKALGMQDLNPVPSGT
jgi:peptidase E